MRTLFIVVLVAHLTGCVTVQRYQTDTVQSQLEEKGHAYQHEQEVRVQTVAHQLMQQIPNPPDVTLIVVPEGKLYAGTTYGKPIITTGMVRFTNTDDELAIILGHELAHHTQGHLAVGAVSQVAIGVLAAVANHYAYGSGRSVQALGQGIYNHYNQNQELEADAVGMRYAAAAGYDPHAGVAVWERISIEAPSTLTASFFDSHPSSPERMLAAQHNAEVILAQGYLPPTHPSTYQPEHPVVQPVVASTAPPIAIAQLTTQVTTPTKMHPVATIAPTLPAPLPYPPAVPRQTLWLPDAPCDAAAWQAYNVISPLPEIQLRALTEGYYAGRITLEEYRRQKQELQ